MKPHECRCGMFEPHKTKTECIAELTAQLQKAEAALASERERRERAEGRVGEYAADATLFARERDITTEKLGKAEARLRQIEEATRDSGIGPAAAAWNLAADYCRAAPAQPTCLCPWPEQDASPRHRPDCNAAQPAPYGAARGKGVQ